MNRRRLLRTGAATLAALVPGCGLGPGDGTPSDDGESRTATETPTATPVATATAEATPTREPTPTATATPTATTAGLQTPPEAAQVVAIADGATTFDPEHFELSTGETAVWVWHSSGHNVQALSRPRGSTFDGTPGDKETTFEEGYIYSHTFEVAGEYEYQCYPYRNYGMQGTLTVTE